MALLDRVVSAACCSRVRERPSYILSDRASPGLRKAIRHCSALKENFELSCISRSPIGSAIKSIPNSDLPSTREEISGLLDGGVVAIDWIGKCCDDPKAVCLILPGVGTTAREGFAAVAAHALAVKFPSYHIGVAVFQGHDGLPLSSNAVISTAYVSKKDTGYMIEHINSKHPDVPKVVVGCSIGSAHFTLWAGCNPEQLQRCNVVGGVMICHGLSARESADAVDAQQGASLHILKGFRRFLSASPIPSHIASPELLAALAAARTLQDWDTAVLPLYGFADREEMLRACDTTPAVLSQINVPLIFLNADNDPLTPAGRLIDKGRVHELVPDCAVARTQVGTHMGWWQGPLWALQQTWASEAISQLVEGLILADEAMKLGQMVNLHDSLSDRMEQDAWLLGQKR